MAVARTSPTMTLLPTGKVLVTGGFTQEGTQAPTASAELYDPATGTWSTTGAMAVPRARHEAVLLPSGKVLVMGASADEAVTISAELYDPATGSFSPTGGMKERRQFGFPAVVLESGKVLVVGGGNSRSSSSVPRSAELYDPATGTWSDVPLPFVASSLSAVRLHAGKVLFAGGTLYQGSYVYQPVTGTWTQTNPLNAPRNAWPTLTRLASGEILLVGGESSPQPVAAQLYAERGPVARARSLRVEQDTALAVTLEATEPDGDAVTCTLVEQPRHGTLTGTPPTLEYVPAAGYSGWDAFSFKASDGLVESETVTSTITVIGKPAPPKDGSCAATGGGPLSAGLWLVVSLLGLARRRSSSML
jgi:hypothetical protein